MQITKDWCICVSWSTAAWFRIFFPNWKKLSQKSRRFTTWSLGFTPLYCIALENSFAISLMLHSGSYLSIRSCLEWKVNYLKICFNFKWVTYNSIFIFKTISCHELSANFWTLFSWHTIEMETDILSGWKGSIFIFWVSQVTFLTEKEIRYVSNCNRNVAALINIL